MIPAVPLIVRGVLGIAALFLALALGVVADSLDRFAHWLVPEVGGKAAHEAEARAMSVQIRFGASGQSGHMIGDVSEKFSSTSFADPRIRASIRHALADEIDRLLNLIDALDDDPDLEPDADGEPSLGWSVTMAHGTTDDAEQGEVTP